MKLILGFIPLLDCASLVVAAERALRRRRMSSWRWFERRPGRTSRQGVSVISTLPHVGPMTVASTLGIGHVRCRYSAFALGRWKRHHRVVAALGADD